MNFKVEYFVAGKRKFLLLLVSLGFFAGVQLAHQPIIFIACLLLVSAGTLLPHSWLTWLAIAIAPLQFTVIGLQNIPYKISYFDVIALLLVISFSWNLAFRKMQLFDRKLLFILGLFCLVGFLSLAPSGFPLSGIYYLLRLVAVLIVFFSVIYFVRTHGFERLLSALLVCLWLVGIVAVINALRRPDLLPSFKVVLEDPGSVERLGSIYNQPNITGHTIGFFLPILLGFSLLWAESRITRFFLMITTIFLALLLFFTESRGGLITGTIGVIILMFYFRKFPLLIIPLILGVILIINWPFLMKLFFDIRFHSIEDRIDLIYYGLKTMMEYPILGIGLRQFETHFHDMPFYLMGRSSHNVYLEVAVETGILGFGVFLAFVIYVWKKLIHATGQNKKSAKLARGTVLSSYISLLCSKLFMGGLLLVTWWIALAVIIGFAWRFSLSESQTSNMDLLGRDEGSHTRG
jgi:O-antigen ligase